MNLFRFAALILLFSVAQPALAADCGQPISVKDVAKLSGIVSLNSLKAKFGQWCQGHGPVSYYKDTNGNEIWFFWRTAKKSVTNGSDPKNYQVLLASIVPADDPGGYQIIWPPEFVGKEVQDVLAKEYDSP